MRERHDFIDYVIELFGLFGTVSAKRMFGGHGVYLDGLMFAMVSREAIWLKADDINRAEFESAGCELFTYSRGGALATIGFYRAPVDATESAAEMLPWARSAYAAALRANARRVAQERERTERRAARAVAAAANEVAADAALSLPAVKRVRAIKAPQKEAAKSTAKSPAKRAVSRTTARAAQRSAARATERTPTVTTKRAAKARPTKAGGTKVRARVTRHRRSPR